MARALNPFLPWASAETIADLSAQMVRPNDLFSTFAAVTTLPSSQSNAAPTLNFEYGEYERPAAPVASLNSCPVSIVYPPVVYARICIDVYSSYYIPFRGYSQQRADSGTERFFGVDAIFDSDDSEGLMYDERSGYVTRTILAVITITLVYTLVFADPLPAELSAVPVWFRQYRVLDKAPDTIADDRLAYAMDDRHGYFSADGDDVTIWKTAKGSAIADTGWVEPQPGNGDSILFSAGGLNRARVAVLNPFFMDDVLYDARGNGTAVAAFGPDGVPAWQYWFPSHISALAVGHGMTVAGTVDGWLEGVDTDGNRLFQFSPGGSRLPVVLGVDVSASGTWIAAVSGIDRQRLVVMGRGGADFRVSSHRYLDSDYREPVRVNILDDDFHILYRRPDGIGVWSVDGTIDNVIPVPADDFDVEDDESNGIAYLALQRGSGAEIAVFKKPARLLGRFALPPGTGFIRLSGSTAFFGGDSWIARLDFIKE